jgi:hypothetical protein
VSLAGVWNERIVPEVPGSKAPTNDLADVDHSGEITIGKAEEVPHV